jgi:hypothetical protein
MSDYYPRMLYRYVGEEDEEYIIVTTQATEDRKRRVGFHHYSEPNPPRKGQKAKEVASEDEAVESQAGGSDAEAVSSVDESPVSEAPEGGEAPGTPEAPGTASEEPQ